MKQRRRAPGPANDPSETVFRPIYLISCIRCHLLHEACSPLEFNPICPACTQRRNTLTLLGMTGTFPLDHDAIERRVAAVSPGNYALGYVIDEAFSVFYIGRSDSDVRSRLHAWVGMPARFDRYASAGKAPWELQPGRALPVGKPAFGRVGTGEDTGYTRFAYSYASSPAAAFARQCRNFVDFGGSRDLDNERAPTRGPDA